MGIECVYDCNCRLFSAVIIASAVAEICTYYFPLCPHREKFFSKCYSYS